MTSRTTTPKLTDVEWDFVSALGKITNRGGTWPHHQVLPKTRSKLFTLGYIEKSPNDSVILSKKGFKAMEARMQNPDMTRKTKTIANPKSRKGKRRGKRDIDVSSYDIARAKKSGTPFVMDIDDKGYRENEVFIINPLEVEDSGNGVVVYWFSNGMGNAPGVVRIAVLNKSIEDGLEEAAGWLDDHARGFILSHNDPHLVELYDDALTELVDNGADPDDEETRSEAQQDATADMVYTESGYLNSWEWGLDDLSSNSDLYKSIVNKSNNLYRKQYDEDPSTSYINRETPRYLRKRYGGDWRKSGLESNPEAASTSHHAAIAARLARGEI